MRDAQSIPRKLNETKSRMLLLSVHVETPHEKTPRKKRDPATQAGIPPKNRRSGPWNLCPWNQHAPGSSLGVATYRRVLWHPFASTRWGLSLRDQTIPCRPVLAAPAIETHSGSPNGAPSKHPSLDLTLPSLDQISSNSTGEY